MGNSGWTESVCDCSAASGKFKKQKNVEKTGENISKINLCY